MITVTIKCSSVGCCYFRQIPVLTSFLKLETNLGHYSVGAIRFVNRFTLINVQAMFLSGLVRMQETAAFSISRQ